MPHKRIVALVVFLYPVIVLGGDASGQFTAGKRPPIKPKYAAAYETRDQRDARKMAVEVVLSEGGEPGKAFNALQSAIAKKSWTGIKGNVTAKTFESFYESDRTEKDNLADAIQTLGFHLPKKPGKITGGELHGDTRSSI